MKTAGWILIALGIIVIVISEFNATVKRTITDTDTENIEKTEDPPVGWAIYAGGTLVIAGIVMTAVSSAKKN